MSFPEDRARAKIDETLVKCGGTIQNRLIGLTAFGDHFSRLMDELNLTLTA